MQESSNLRFPPWRGAGFVKYVDAAYCLVHLHEARTHVIVFLDRQHENPAVADPAGPCGAHHGFDNIFDSIVLRHDVDYDFRQKRHLVLQTAVDDRVPALPPMSSGFRDGQAPDKVFERRGCVFKFVRLDDALDELHAGSKLFFNVHGVSIQFFPYKIVLDAAA